MRLVARVCALAPFGALAATGFNPTLAVTVGPFRFICRLLLDCPCCTL
jgi:hypothetical protein